MSSNQPKLNIMPDAARVTLATSTTESYTERTLTLRVNIANYGRPLQLNTTALLTAGKDKLVSMNKKSAAARVILETGAYDSYIEQTLTLRINNVIYGGPFQLSATALLTACHDELFSMIHDGYACRICNESDHISVTCPHIDDVITAYGSIDAFLHDAWQNEDNMAPATGRHHDHNETAARVRWEYDSGSRVTHYFVLRGEVYEPAYAAAYRGKAISIVCRHGRRCSNAGCEYLHKCTSKQLGADKYNKIIMIASTGQTQAYYKSKQTQGPSAGLALDGHLLSASTLST